MNFLRDLFRWFLRGERRKNAPSFQPEIKAAEEPIPEIKEPVQHYQSPTFDFLKEHPAHEFLVDLQSIRPLAEQFDRARAELLKELQRLAPPQTRRFDIFRKKAA